jgi:hypothetical protein
MPVRGSVPIEIPECTRYSLGEAINEGNKGDEDHRPRSPVLWVAAEGYWFEINPSAAYLPMYRTICEAIRLYYSIYDVYSTKGAKYMNRLSKSTDPIERLSEVFFQVRISYIPPVL